MNLHEYQAKDVFRSYGIPVPAGQVAASPEEAVEAARALGGTVWVVKAQVHAGGRGKAGGVKLVREIDAVRTAAERILGKPLVTQQTGPEGLPVDKVYVECGSDIARELYLSVTLNRERGRIAFIASAAGGMEIEEVAHRTPERILSATVHPAAGLGEVDRVLAAVDSGRPALDQARLGQPVDQARDVALGDIEPRGQFLLADALLLGQRGQDVALRDRNADLAQPFAYGL